MLCGHEETARASFSLHAAGFAEAACMESVMILGRRLPCLVPMGSSRELALRVLQCHLVLNTGEKYLENHSNSVGVPEKSPPPQL